MIKIVLLINKSLTLCKCHASQLMNVSPASLLINVSPASQLINVALAPVLRLGAGALGVEKQRTSA